MPSYSILQRHRLDGIWREIGETVEFPQQHGDSLVAAGVLQRLAVAGPTIPRAADVNPMPRAFAKAPAAISTKPRRCCGWK